MIKYRYDKPELYPHGYTEYFYNGVSYGIDKISKDGYIGNETHMSMGLKIILGLLVIASCIVMGTLCLI